MEEIFSILPATFVFLSLAVWALTLVVRTIMEAIFSSLKANATWNDHILEILPILIGSIGSFAAKKFPFPNGLTTISGRIVFGLAAGLLASSVYRKVKSLMPKDPTNGS
jgi:hypothetical protein